MMGKRYPPTYKPHVVPASVGGINALDSLISMPQQDCIYCWNIAPSEYGLRVRKGYSQWVEGMDGDVKSLVQFEGQLESSSTDRLFGVTSAGIYNITLLS